MLQEEGQTISGEEDIKAHITQFFRFEGGGLLGIGIPSSYRRRKQMADQAFLFRRI